MPGLFATKPLSLLLSEKEEEGHQLKRVLGPVELTSLGVGATIGVGIFVVTGVVAHDRTGPALMASFVVAAVACMMAALCYSEFASMVPVAGSAYTYAYATLGELFAWIIGWDLILEYAVGAAAVANGWSGYFRHLLAGMGVHIPAQVASAPIVYEAGTLRFTGSWFDLMALVVVSIIALLLIRGIRESAGFNSVMVIVKVAIVVFVIGLGAFYVNPANWHPFAPFGWTGIGFLGHTLLGGTAPDGSPVGMLAGAGLMFFAYIGFDSVSTQSEEARHPQRDLPIAIIGSLVLCTVLYIGMAAVLTGMVPYTQINISAPVADAFQRAGLHWARSIIDLAAIAGITSVLLVLMLGQSRILMAMGRDGLLPAGFFAAVHPRFRTPWKATIVTWLFIGALAGFLPLGILAELVSIGTLLAFVIVCAAVPLMRRTNPQAERPFRTPFVPVVPALGVVFCVVLMLGLPPASWVRLVIWLLIGLAIYFGYGRAHSALRRYADAPPR